MSISHSGGASARLGSATLSPDEQRSLTERLESGDPSAEEDLVRLFSARISCFVRMRTHDAEAARDLTQEILLAVVHAIRQRHLRDSERLGAFVYGIARNLTSNFLRTRGRQPTETPLDEAAHRVSAPDPFEASDRTALVRRAIGVLDSIDRQILLLTLVEGLKPGEIAARLGLTPEVVRTRKSRALKRAAERVRTLSRS